MLACEEQTRLSTLFYEDSTYTFTCRCGNEVKSKREETNRIVHIDDGFRL